MTSENWNKKIALRTGLMAAVIGIGMSGAALAEEAADDGFPGTFSGSVTLASEYVFRGISLSDEDPAIQDDGWAASDAENLGGRVTRRHWDDRKRTSMLLIAFEAEWQLTVSRQPRA